jgi:hypothetical protein
LRVVSFINGGDSSFPSVSYPLIGGLGFDEWHFVIFKYSTTTNKLYIRCDNSATVEFDVVPGSAPSPDGFRIGNYGSDYPDSDMFGRIGHEQIYKGFVTTDEQDTYLWNNGAGIDLFA